MRKPFPPAREGSPTRLQRPAGDLAGDANKLGVVADDRVVKVEGQVEDGGVVKLCSGVDLQTLAAVGDVEPDAHKALIAVGSCSGAAGAAMWMPMAFSLLGRPMWTFSQTVRSIH